MWNFTKDGVYTTKSGYWVALSMKDVASSNPSTLSSNSTSWNWIWHLQLPPKIQIFLWSIKSSQLALNKRGIEVNQNCPRCGLVPESDIHALCDCAWSADFWKACPLRMNMQSLPVNLCLSDWIPAVVENKNAEFIQIFAFQLWIAWRARNLLVFKNEIMDHQTCFRISLNLWQEFSSTLNAARHDHASGNSMDKWRPSIRGRIKLNFDASIQKEIGAGLGGVFRDESGEGRLAFAMKEGCCEITIAEALACLEGVRLAKEENFKNIVIESDCSELISDLKRASQPPSYMGNIISAIHALLHNFELVEFTCSQYGTLCFRLILQ